MQLRIREIRKRRGWTLDDLADRVSLSKNYLSEIERGKARPNIHRLEQIARALGVTVSDLITEPTVLAETELLPAEIDSEAPPALITVYGVEASAGHGRFALDDYEVTTLAFPREYLRDLTKTSPKHLAILSVKGDSMEPTLPDDSLVMIDTTKRDLSWDGIFVLKDDGDGILVKRIGRAGRRGHVKVISDNDRYAPTERSAAEIEVIGRVLWYGRKV